MGIFKKSSYPLLTEDGELWDPEIRSQEDLFFYDRARRRKLGIHKQDIQSYSEASYAYNIGLPRDFEILAWGPVEIYGFPESYNKMQGTAVVTEECVMCWWLPSPIKKFEVFTAIHPDIINIDPFENGWGAFLTYSRAHYSDQKGRRPIPEVEIGVGVRLGKDGQENRRAMTFFTTYAHFSKGWLRP